VRIRYTISNLLQATKHFFQNILSAQRDWDIVGLLTYFDGSNTVLLPAPSGDGFIALKGPPDGYLKEIFQFKCTIIGCEWTEKIRRLKESHNMPVLMYIPNSLTVCRQKTQEEVQLETMIKELMDKRIEIWKAQWARMRI